MTKRRGLFPVVMTSLLCAGLACGGDGNPPPPAPTDGPIEVPDAAPIDQGGELDTGIETAPADLGGDTGNVNPAAIKLLPAGTQLLGGASNGCSHGAQSLASGARWCAFAQTAAGTTRLELWVADISQRPVTCDGSSPSCVRLSEDLFAGRPAAGPSFPSAHAWSGDTLVYYAGAQTGSTQLYSGPVWAWRPGWPAPKKISAGDRASLCVVHPAAAVGYCRENAAGTGETATFDLTAGKLDSAPFTMVAKINLFADDEAQTWNTRLSPDGKYLLYSTGAPAAGPGQPVTPETLYYADFDKIGVDPPTQAGAPDLNAWEVAPDASKWFYLREHEFAGASVTGTLFMSDFPTGANEVRLASGLVKAGGDQGVLAFELLARSDGKLGLISIAQGYNEATQQAQHVVIRDPAGNLDDPANVTEVLPATQTLPVISPDLRFGWYHPIIRDGLGAVSIARYDGMPGCTLTENARSTRFGPAFSAGGALAFWLENYDGSTRAGDGWAGSPDCTTGRSKFATRIDQWFVQGDDQLIYSDETEQYTANLRIARAAGGTITQGALIELGIERMFWVLPNQEAVVYRIANGAAGVNGIYYYKITP